METVQRGPLAAVIALVLSGCAASPESIQARYINDSQYSYLNCAQLAAYRVTLAHAYVEAADTEDNARNLDAATFLIVPVGSMTHESLPFQISDLKGRIAAVDRLEVKDNCSARRVATTR